MFLISDKLKYYGFTKILIKKEEMLQNQNVILNWNHLMTDKWKKAHGLVKDYAKYIYIYNKHRPGTKNNKLIL